MRRKNRSVKHSDVSLTRSQLFDHLLLKLSEFAMILYYISGVSGYEKYRYVRQKMQNSKKCILNYLKILLLVVNVHGKCLPLPRSSSKTKKKNSQHKTKIHKTYMEFRISHPLSPTNGSPPMSIPTSRAIQARKSWVRVKAARW